MSMTPALPPTCCPGPDAPLFPTFQLSVWSWQRLLQCRSDTRTKQGMCKGGQLMGKQASTNSVSICPLQCGLGASPWAHAPGGGSLSSHSLPVSPHSPAIIYGCFSSLCQTQYLCVQYMARNTHTQGISLTVWTPLYSEFSPMGTRQDLGHLFPFIPCSLWIFLWEYVWECLCIFQLVLWANYCTCWWILFIYFFFIRVYLIYHIVFQVYIKMIQLYIYMCLGFPLGSVVKESP